jgi:methylenetetrahydrofolate dehydrogenase (NADP+)/methenyltetrahydrofolate cyclohydrolase
MKYTIRLHEKAAENLGFYVLTETRPHTASEQGMFDLVEALNKNDKVHAIVLLQPLPMHLDAIRIIGRIDKNKEVEGFHPDNIANMLAGQNQHPMVLPTALHELFANEKVPVLPDSEWVFVVDDEFFERPFTNMIARTACVRVVPHNNSVTIVNNNSGRLTEHIKKADFLFIISKKPGFLKAEWLKPGVCIVDVYSNLVKEVPSKKNPDVLIPIIKGGVFPEKVNNVAGKLAPCPGGLMPLVLAVLLRNALNAFKANVTA